MKSPFDYNGEKCHKQSRSRSPERKRYNRSRSQSLQSPFEYHGKKCCKKSRSRSPERKRYKRSQSQSLQSPFDYHAEKHRKVNKSCSRSPQKSTHHSWSKVSPQVAINSSNKNSSLNRGLSQCTILNSDKRRPELTHHVQLNSTQEKSLFNTASVRGRSQSP